MGDIKMKFFSTVLIVMLFLLVLISGPVFADSTLHKGKDFTVEIEGDKLIFTLTRAGVTQASIPGAFNGWKPDAPEAQMQEKDGKFVLEVDLATFAKAVPQEFKFHVNGKWDEGNNKALNIQKKKGAWLFVVSPVERVKPNTKNSADIEFHGRTSSFIRYAKNALQNSFLDGDGDFYFDRSFIDLDLSMLFKIGSRIVGKAILNYNYNQNNETKNLILDKYETKIHLDLFTVNVFYGERIVEFKNPTRGLDKFVTSYASTITFFKEPAGEIGRFGRDYLGMVFAMDLLGGELQAVVARDRANNIFNTVMAARYYNNLLVGKQLGFGVTLVYEKYRDEVDREQQSFMSLFDPLRFYHKYFDKYNEYQLSADVDFSAGDFVVFAEGKFAFYADDGTANAATLMDLYITGGLKFSSGAIRAEAVAIKSIQDSDAADLTDVEEMLIVLGKFGYKVKEMGLAVQVGAYMLETSKTVLNGRALANFEFSFFDLFVNAAYVSQDAYMSTDMRTWIEWYLTGDFRILAGGRLAIYKDASTPSDSYINPYAGIGYKAGKNFNFKLYIGLNPGYDVYREDKGYTIESYIGERAADLNANYVNKEKRMKKNLAINLEVDASF